MAKKIAERVYYTFFSPAKEPPGVSDFIRYEKPTALKALQSLREMFHLFQHPRRAFHDAVFNVNVLHPP